MLYSTRFLIVFSLLLFISCASFYHGQFHPSYINLVNRDFKIVKSVSASSSASYFFGIGGLNKTTLVKEAKENLYRKYELGENQAYYNFTEDVIDSYLWFPFYYSRTFILSADIIELYNSDTMISNSELGTNLGKGEFQDKYESVENRLITNLNALNFDQEEAEIKVRYIEDGANYNLKSITEIEDLKIGDIVKLDRPYKGEKFVTIKKFIDPQMVEIQFFPKTDKNFTATINIKDIKLVEY